MYYSSYVVLKPTNFSDIKCDISELRDDNYKVWNKRILLYLGCMDIDYAIRKDEPCITEISTPAEIALRELWKQSTSLSVMFIKTKISSGIRDSVDQHDNIKALLKVIDEWFETSYKTFANTLIMKFLSLRLTSVRSVC